VVVLKQDLDRVKLPRNPIRRSDFVQRVLNLWTYEKKLQPKARLGLRMKSLGRGFTSDSLLMYQSAHHKLEDCVNDWVRYVKAPDINARRKYLVADKSLFSLWFGGLLPVPRNYGVSVRGRFVPFEGFGNFSSLRELICAQAPDGKLVFKPTGGGSGNGIVIAKWSDNELFVNGNPMEVEKLEEHLTKQRELLISEFVEQADYARKIFPETTNTLRVLTMIDPETDEAFIARAVHRFGSRESIPVDNFKQGGIVVDIDLETGVLGKGATRTEQGGVRFVEEHPESGVRVEGVQIPHWEKLQQQLLAAVDRVGVLPYVGWDIVVTNDGFSVLEGNSCTGVNILQLHRPLLSDPRVRRFYEHHRMTKPR
jgi:hypothetical protein